VDPETGVIIAHTPWVERDDITLDRLEHIAVLGEGAFGLVRLVRLRGTSEVFALKQMQKARIVSTGQQRNVLNEKAVLTRCRGHPYILQLYKTFKDRDCLYVLLEFLQGGDLFGLLLRVGGTLEAPAARYYAGIVTLVLQYLHAQSIVYRDLKPENLVLDAGGFLKVVDFGFAKVVTKRTYTLCGTPEYLAPELVQGKGHGKGVDYWALGVLVYEMLVGYSPFADHERNEQLTIYKNIIRGKLAFPRAMRDEVAKDLIRGLLNPNPSQRTGCLKGGANDIKRLRWYASFDWTALATKALPPPIVPRVKSPTDVSNFDDFAGSTAEVQHYRDDGSGWDVEF
jgi:serine/threonine protein kinase